MSRVNVTVTIDDDHLETIVDVVEELRCRGLEVEHVLGSIGTVTGSVDPAGSVSLREVEGVADVSEARAIQLPPPDSPVQ